jgi:hypothetical protein
VIFYCNSLKQLKLWMFLCNISCLIKKKRIFIIFCDLIRMDSNWVSRNLNQFIFNSNCIFKKAIQFGLWFLTRIDSSGSARLFSIKTGKYSNLKKRILKVIHVLKFNFVVFVEIFLNILCQKWTLWSLFKLFCLNHSW